MPGRASGPPARATGPPVRITGPRQAHRPAPVGLCLSNGAGCPLAGKYKPALRL
ncbi:MAG: hypothetical protein KIB49_00555 [Clostridiales bacterium]|nr:hypothetical protein [Clostridiales bacterium]